MVLHSTSVYLEKYGAPETSDSVQLPKRKVAGKAMVYARQNGL